MYLERFGLRERPFTDAPDARFVYLGERHERALAHLRQGVQVPGGVTYLVGAGGLGKTTLCRLLLSRLPTGVDVALIPDPAPTRQELLSVVSDQLGVAHGMDAPSLILGESLLRRQAAGLTARRTAVIVDEAQSLDLDVLEQLDLLSSLEMAGQKLLAIVLVGEPWLLDLLARAGTRRSSPPTGHHLLPFSENETRAYVRHRVTIAGGRPDLFDAGALRDVHRLSSGVPGAINAICARALVHAGARRRRRVDRSTVRAAARSAHAPAGSPTPGEFDDCPPVDPTVTAREPARSPAARSRRPRWPWLVAGGLALNALAIGVASLPPRGHNDALAPSDTRGAAEPAPPNDAPPPGTSPTADDDGARDARPPEPAESIAPPVTIARPVAPPPARPAPPVTSLAGEPSAPSKETPRQRRRRERAELRSAAASRAPVSEPAPPQPSPPQPSALKIDMLVWSTEPRQRLVYVNGRKYVEGQTLESGALLERIEADAIVLVQDGRRLRLRSEAR